jgi:hypothetical protein
MASASSRSWFLVYNNPEMDNVYKTAKNGKVIIDEDGKPIILDSKPSFLSGLPAEQICNVVLNIWQSGADEDEERTGAAVYCKSADGLLHLHIVVCSSKKITFGTVKKCFPKAHIEPTQGNKQQAEDYIQKVGEWQEKGEELLCNVVYHGDIIGNQGKRNDVDNIEKLLDQGKKPREILTELGFKSQRYETMIRSAYFLKRYNDTPFYRDIEVVWHVGESGSGKSFTAVKLVEQGLQDDMYMMTDYEGGGLDHYNGEDILFMDEYRGQIKYSTLLMMLQGYKQQFHARYTNIYGLWTKVHITSVMPPEMVYQKMVEEHQNIDTLKQLLRRINTIVYHWKDDNKGYHQYSMPMKDYIDYNDLKGKVLMNKDGFIDIKKYNQEELPFVV